MSTATTTTTPMETLALELLQSARRDTVALPALKAWVDAVLAASRFQMTLDAFQGGGTAAQIEARSLDYAGLASGDEFGQRLQRDMDREVFLLARAVIFHRWEADEAMLVRRIADYHHHMMQLLENARCEQDYGA